MNTLSRFFRLRKYTHALRHYFHLYKRKEKKLPEEQKLTIQNSLKNLQEAILQKNVDLAKQETSNVESLSTQFLSKTPFEKFRNLVVALVVALCLAVLIRQLWFEFYEIPTGSMRPTLKEQDRLVVSKTTFGINFPLALDHLYFSSDLVQRGGIVVFTGENMDIRDVDTKYFYLFPGKKQYVKRMIGKPGDSIYFYGGLLYGVDKDGNDISSELQLTRLDQIEHIPFLQFEGKVTTPLEPTNGVYSPVILRQMNEQVARLTASNLNQATGKLLPNTETSYDKSYSDMWGFKNFGMARILTKQQALLFTQETMATLPVAPYYLEILHHPSLKNLKIRKDNRNRLRPMLDLRSSVIPLTEDHLKTLFENLYTVRFIVKNGIAHQYGLPSAFLQSPFLPKIDDVPDGTYEFYYGKAYEISFQGLSRELPKEHPLYRFTPEKVQFFYNLGMEFDTRYTPQSKYTPFFPIRYVYFKDHALYAMGAPLFSKEDPILLEFNTKEQAKQAAAPVQYSYEAFQDFGPPTKEDGSLDVEFVKHYGLTIPKKMYLVLGDNHAVSADSREFGFVPEENLKGAPDFIFWPPGSRFGHPNQAPYPFMNFPRLIIWLIAGSAITGYLFYQRKRNKLPLL